MDKGTKKKTGGRWLLGKLKGVSGFKLLGKRLIKRVHYTRYPISQVFKAEYDNLNTITVLCNPGPLPSLHPLVATLSEVDSPDHPLVQQIIRPTQLQNGHPLSIRFKPLGNSHGRKYRLTISQRKSPHSTNTMWMYVRRARPDSELFVNEQLFSGELVMVSSYGPSLDHISDQWDQHTWDPISFWGLDALFRIMSGFLTKK